MKQKKTPQSERPASWSLLSNTMFGVVRESNEYSLDVHVQCFTRGCTEAKDVLKRGLVTPKRQKNHANAELLVILSNDQKEVRLYRSLRENNPTSNLIFVLPRQDVRNLSFYF